MTPNQANRDLAVMQAHQAVREEMERQDKKWGEQNHSPSTWILILTEEIGETSEAALHDIVGDWTIDPYEKELTQVAAVAIQALACLNRYKLFKGVIPVTST